MTKELALLLGFIASVLAIILKSWMPSGESIGCKTLETSYWLAVSYIPGYLVYLLAVYFPTKRDRKLLAPFIARESEQVCLLTMGLLRDINRALGTKLSMTSDLPEIEIAWSKIDRESVGPAIKRTNPIVSCTWMEVIYDYRFRAIKSIDNLLCYVPYLEAPHLRLLTNIRHCYFFTCVHGAFHSDGSPNTFHIPANALYELIRLSVELDSLLTENMRGVDYVKLSDYPDSCISSPTRSA